MSIPPPLPNNQPGSDAVADCRRQGLVIHLYTLLNLIGFVAVVGVVAHWYLGDDIQARLNAMTAEEAEVVLMVALIAGCSMALGLISIVLQFLAAVGMRKQRYWVLCMVMAGWMLASLPLGTVLGIWMIMTLQRPDVKAAFGRPVPAPG